jgi:hypothetical protein
LYGLQRCQSVRIISTMTGLPPATYKVPSRPSSWSSRSAARS